MMGVGVTPSASGLTPPESRWLACMQLIGGCVVACGVEPRQRPACIGQLLESGTKLKPLGEVVEVLGSCVSVLNGVDNTPHAGGDALVGMALSLPELHQLVQAERQRLQTSRSGTAGGSSAVPGAPRVRRRARVNRQMAF